MVSAGPAPGGRRGRGIVEAGRRLRRGLCQAARAKVMAHEQTTMAGVERSEAARPAGAILCSILTGGGLS